LGGENYAGGGTDAGDFFNHNSVADVVHARAALGFGDGDAGEAKFGGFLEKLAGKLAFFVVLAREGFYFGFGEIADAFLEEFLFFG
jgi:hypothetical protein